MKAAYPLQILKISIDNLFLYGKITIMNEIENIVISKTQECTSKSVSLESTFDELDIRFTIKYCIWVNCCKSLGIQDMPDIDFDNCLIVSDFVKILTNFINKY